MCCRDEVKLRLFLRRALYPASALIGLTESDLVFRQFMNAYADANSKYSLSECTRIGTNQYKELISRGLQAVKDRTSELESIARKRREKEFGSMLRYLKPAPKAQPGNSNLGSGTRANIPEPLSKPSSRGTPAALPGKSTSLTSSSSTSSSHDYQVLQQFVLRGVQ